MASSNVPDSLLITRLKEKRDYYLDKENLFLRRIMERLFHNSENTVNFQCIHDTTLLFHFRKRWEEVIQEIDEVARLEKIWRKGFDEEESEEDEEEDDEEDDDEEDDDEEDEEDDEEDEEESDGDEE